MNRIYRLVYNRKLGRIDVVSELVSPCSSMASDTVGSVQPLRAGALAGGVALALLGIAAPQLAEAGYAVANASQSFRDGNAATYTFQNSSNASFNGVAMAGAIDCGLLSGTSSTNTPTALTATNIYGGTGGLYSSKITPQTTSITYGVISNGAINNYSAAQSINGGSFYVTSAQTPSAANAATGQKFGDNAALGMNSFATGCGSQALGLGSFASGWGSSAIGTGTTAMGINAYASGNGSYAQGTQASAIAQDAQASGTLAAASGVGSLAYGAQAAAATDGAIAIGQNAGASAINAVAVGNGASATQANSVALGASSATTLGVNTASATIAGKTYSNFAGVTPATDGVVSVGSAGHERQIQNVAAGQITATSTDAINGSQVYSINWDNASSLASLSTGLSTTNSNVSSLSTWTSTSLSTTNSTITSLSTSTSTGLSTATSSITSLSTSTSTGLSTATSSITSLSTSTSTGLSTATSSITSLSSSTSTGLSTAESGIASLSSSTSTGFATLSSSVSTNASNITSLSSGLSTTNSNVTSLSTS
uniref:ESPR-type extended signal peptide-containing protein n=1 Tax=Dyella japonica TaxID=231455 RepID=UPI002351CA04